MKRTAIALAAVFVVMLALDHWTADVCTDEEQLSAVSSALLPPG